MHSATSEHQTRKRDDYWADLMGGGTAAYKLAVLERLLVEHRPSGGGAILDVGCGTSEASLLLRHLVGSPAIVRCDYDATIVARSAARCTDASVSFRVADIFDLDGWDDRFSLVLFLDMLHEVYSFVGRGLDVSAPIDHAVGRDAVFRALESVARLVVPGGAIAITDNVLTPTDMPVRIRVRPSARLAVERFLTEYPSRRMAVAWDGDVLDIGSHDLCIVLTQYNKIKCGDEDRWAVEQLEIHQYLTLDEYRTAFDDLGFDIHAVVGTPDDAAAEWASDFEVVAGLDRLPDKRITLLAVRR